MSSLPLPIEVPPAEIETFCRRWKIDELSLFGSVLRSDFRPDSDVDVLVSFRSDATWSLFDLVRMEDELQSILGRKVDLVEREAVERSENYIRRKSILSHLQPIWTGSGWQTLRIDLPALITQIGPLVPPADDSSQA